MRFKNSIWRQRGSALVMGIVVSIIVSGLIVTMAWTAGILSQTAANLSKTDPAYFAAESGIQRVAWYCKNGGMSSITSPITGTVNGYAYSTSWTTVSGSTIRITSVGSLGSVSSTLSVAVTPPSPAVATFASSGDFDNKNVIITGNVATAGNYTNGGSGSLTGNLVYGGTASNTGSITGTVTQGSFTTIDFSALDTTLRANATTLGTNATYDFTTLSGTNKVIYVNGNVTNPTIIGSGTLYVKGKIHYTNSNVTVGAAGAPVYLVATSDISFDKSATIYGGLYTKKDWNRAQVDLIGVVYVGGISPSNSGSSSMTLGSAPWFDPRVTSGNGTGTPTTFTSFAGIQP